MRAACAQKNGSASISCTTPRVIRRLVDVIRPLPADVMVEIGGGPGALTIPLAAKLERLHVVEIDRELAAALPSRVAHPERLVVHEADALAFDFGALAAGPRSLRVVGNLPYNISTPLLFHLATFAPVIKDLHVMLQREVVDRITAAPGGKEYGRLTVMLSLFARAEVCFDIGPGAFSAAAESLVDGRAARAARGSAVRGPRSGAVRESRRAALLDAAQDARPLAEGTADGRTDRLRRHRSEGAPRDAGAGRLRAARGARDVTAAPPGLPARHNAGTAPRRAATARGPWQ